MVEQTFFPGARRQVDLKGVTALRATNGESRIKLQCSPMDGGALVGMPGWLADAYSAVAKAGSGIRAANLDVKYDGMNVTTYATSSSKRDLVLGSCQLQKFAVMHEGSEDEGAVSLHFVLYVPMHSDTWKWAGGMIGNSFWMGFEQTQAEIFGKGHADDGEGEEEEEAAEDRQPALV